MQRSGDAVDSDHRYSEDMRLLADAGLNSYRFGIEWARNEPTPGNFSRVELAHYHRMMIDQAAQLGLTPVITLQHFTTPNWFADEGGWLADQATDRFATYVEQASTILGDVPYVITMNEPNMQAMTITIMQSILAGQTAQWQSPPVEALTNEEGMWSAAALPDPDPAIGKRLVAAHQAAREVLHAATDAAVGWTVANGARTARPGAEDTLRELNYIREDLYLEAARDDDFVGVQAYSSQEVDMNGLVPHQPHPDDNLVGTAYRPDGLAVRHTSEVTRQTPILLTENGIATKADEQRIRLHHWCFEGTSKHDGRRYRCARLPSLVSLGQLRVGSLGTHLRTDRRRPINVRTTPETKPGMAGQRSRTRRGVGNTPPAGGPYGMTTPPWRSLRGCAVNALPRRPLVELLPQRGLERSGGGRC